MRVIIAGSRSITNYADVCNAVSLSGFDITTVVSGTANGVDQLGELYAKNNNIKIDRYPADWTTHGKKAGFLRNVQMSENCDAVIVVWDGFSKGSLHMINIAKRKKLLLYIHELK